MFESRMFDEPEKPIEDFEYQLPDSDEVLNTPFPIVALTYDNRILGTGRVIGKLEVDGDLLPVIEIEDEMAPDGLVHLLGSECIWAPATDDLIEAYAKIGGFVHVQAHEYSQELDNEYRAGRN
jgi:hypothetical protein